jgi:ABC-2 type transport system permease protein
VIRRSLWPLVFWGVGAAFVAYGAVIIVPNVETLQQMADLAETLPPSFLQAFGGENVQLFATPEGYLSINLFSWMMPVLAVYSILAGLAVTANEEEQGILDLVISLPLMRWRILLEKTLAYMVIIIANVVLMLIGLWYGVVTTPPMTISNTRLVEATLNMIPGLLLVMAFTVMVSTLARRRNMAAGITSAFLIVSYLVDLLGRAAKGTIWDKLRVVSFYSYHDNPGVMLNGLSWPNVLGLLVVTVLMIAVSVWAFEQRDVGV